MVARVGEDPAAGDLAVESPGLLGALLRGEPGLCQGGSDQPERADRALREPPPAPRSGSGGAGTDAPPRP